MTQYATARARAAQGKVGFLDLRVLDCRAEYDFLPDIYTLESLDGSKRFQSIHEKSSDKEVLVLNCIGRRTQPDQGSELQAEGGKLRMFRKHCPVSPLKTPRIKPAAVESSMARLVPG